MGVLVLFTLAYKRSREKPMRPWQIWYAHSKFAYSEVRNRQLVNGRMFDVSKQVAGQMFVHGLNLFISDIAADHTSGNPCVLYFLNILIDTTLGEYLCVYE